MRSFSFRNSWAGATADERRQFRSALTKLKKAGVLPERIDPKTAIPSAVVRGPRGGVHTLQSIVADMDPLLSDKATAIKHADKATIDHYQKQGYEVTNFAGTDGPILLVPNSAGEKVALKKGEIVRSFPGTGISARQVPVEIHNIDSYLKQLKAMQEEAPPRSVWAFNFYGGKSHATFSNTKFLAEYLSHYRKRFSKKEWSRTLPQLELITTTQPVKWRNAAEEARSKSHGRRPDKPQSKRRKKKAKKKGKKQK